MKKNKLILILLLLISVFIGINSVYADDETCRADAKNKAECDACNNSYWYGPKNTCNVDYCAGLSYQECGHNQSCAFKDNKCQMNGYDKTLFETATSTTYEAKDDETTPCNLRNENTCHSDSNSSSYSCIWVEANEKLYKNRGVTKSYCNTNDLIYIACGDAVDIPRQAPKVFSSVYTVFQLGVPIVLIITSIITLIGAITANSEDVMNKAKGKLFKKMIAAILVFLVMSISKFIISLVPVEEGGADMDHLAACLDCFLNDDCKGNSYYKTYIDNEWHCTALNTDNTTLCKNMFSNSTYAEEEKIANTDG